ncbi:MAG: zf-HC2 domain-containing protein [Candidatus Kapabacteria bacterium]|nr:zf-HC2 domain-containing protein [Candidatus Kapabacteria bacterium]
MKHQYERTELISAYLDGELHDADERAFVEHLLATDSVFQREVELLGALRTNIRSRTEQLKIAVPVSLERSIRLSLGEEVVRQSKAESTPSLLQRLLQRLSRPLVAIPAALVVALGITGIYMMINRNVPGSEETTVAKASLFELSSASYANFQSVVRGDIKLVRTSSDTAELQRFFREQGVTYTVFYPQIDAELKGGVVSQHGDKKFAHLVYGSGSHLVYLFEVDVPSLESGAVTLAAEISKDVKESRWHWEEKDNVGTLFVWQSNTVMCSAVSDLNTQEFSALFRLETL